MTVILARPDNIAKAEISRDSYLKPKEYAQELKRRGIGEKDVGAGTIYDLLVTEYGAVHLDMPAHTHRANAIRTVNRWIEGIEHEGLDVPYDEKKVPSEIRSFSVRLDLVKSAFLDERLTKRELSYVSRVFNEFQDPFGENIDLIAQFAVLWELAERDAMGKECADIEAMLAFAPWHSEANSELYSLSVHKGPINNPPMLRLISPVVPNGQNASFPEVMIGAYAQLGLPWCFGWIQQHPGGQRLELSSRREESEVPMTIEYWKPKCDWKKLIEARLTDQPIQNVTIHIERESSDD